MFTVKPSQMNMLWEERRIQFREKLARHISTVFSRPAQIAGTKHVDKLVDLALKRAARHGFHTIATVQSYSDHMIMLGAFFDEDPLLMHVAAPLSDPDITNKIARMDKVYERAIVYRQEIEGQGAIRLYEALARLSTYIRSADRIRATSRANLIALFERIYPEKASVMASALHPALDRAEAEQKARGLITPQGHVIHGLVSLMAGSGWLDNPMFIGAAPIEHAALIAETEPIERGKKLHGCVEIYLSSVMEIAREEAPYGLVRDT